MHCPAVSILILMNFNFSQRPFLHQIGMTLLIFPWYGRTRRLIFQYLTSVAVGTYWNGFSVQPSVCILRGHVLQWPVKDSFILSLTLASEYYRFPKINWRFLKLLLLVFVCLLAFVCLVFFWRRLCTIRCQILSPFLENSPVVLEFSFGGSTKLLFQFC